MFMRFTSSCCSIINMDKYDLSICKEACARVNAGSPSDNPRCDYDIIGESSVGYVVRVVFVSPSVRALWWHFWRTL